MARKANENARDRAEARILRELSRARDHFIHSGPIHVAWKIMDTIDALEAVRAQRALLAD
jgi:hypothetical protein